MEAIKDYFERYPHSNEVFVNDGVLFHTRGAAESYGKGDVVKHTRPKNPANNEPLSGGGDSLEDAKTAAIETLNSADVEFMEYKDMKAVAKALQLITPDQKTETLKAALIEYKTNLNNA